MAKQPPIDPLRARMLELTSQVTEHTTQLRDYTANPGNAWLAKGELQVISQILSDMEALLEDIKQADAENGY